VLTLQKGTNEMIRPSTVPIATESKSSSPSPVEASRHHLEPHSPRPDSPPAARILMVKSLYEAHHSKVNGFLCRLIGAERAADVTQEVFFRVLRVKNLERRVVTVSYLYRVGENLVRKGYHRDRRSREVMEDLQRSRKTNEAPESKVPASETQQGFIRAGDLGSAMKSLNEHERSAINLIVCRGLSHEQAARSLGVNASTINNWKHRGVKKLQEHLRIHEWLDGERTVEHESGHCRSGNSRRSDGEQGENPRAARRAGESVCRTGHADSRFALGRVG
jgi:RNA polymerase sigma factor (sigma-70 family)